MAAAAAAVGVVQWTAPEEVAAFYFQVLFRAGKRREGCDTVNGSEKKEEAKHIAEGFRGGGMIS